jgi:hypothetical protein
MFFNALPMDAALPVEDQAWRHRLNGLGSSYYFTKVILKRKRLTDSLHLPICLSLEKEHLKDVKEYPRDHFKTTIACEGNPVWRVLPYGDQDEEKFRQYEQAGIFDCTDPETGVSVINEFCDWQRRIHNPHSRNLIVSENKENSLKIGTRIRRHFESNALFRTFYPEILPTTQEKWTDSSLQIHIPGGHPDPHGEGTFDFIGVGGALQSRHYNGLLLQDDLVGRKAIESPTVMDKTIEYHQLIVGVFDNDDSTHESDELVIGNRWGFHDLNSHVVEHEPWFVVESHGAMGGCCNLHPHGVPIFPEEFGIKKLMRLKERLGTYKFSCQFLNNPVSPENADFQESWLNWFEIVVKPSGERVIRHEVKDGFIRKDIPVSTLRKAIATDPTHSQNAAAGRCRHAIAVVGMSDVGNYYLLDCWAKTCTYAEYFRTLFDMAKKWDLHRVGFETSAGQGLGAYHLEYYSRLNNYRIKIVELKGEAELADGTMSHKKEFRIRDVLSPIAEFGRFFTMRRWQDFLGEYNTFPKGRFMDILDTLAYIPQLLRNPINDATRKQMQSYNKQLAKLVGQPYSVGAPRSNTAVPSRILSAVNKPYSAGRFNPNPGISYSTGNTWKN